MYQNAKQDARIEHDGALRRFMIELPADHTGLFEQFGDNLGFVDWLSDTISRSTYMEPPVATP